MAAKGARNAALAADNAKKGLDSDLMDLVSVPKYIPDRMFADVLLHVLTADETINALSQEGNSDLQDERFAGHCGEPVLGPIRGRA